MGSGTTQLQYIPDHGERSVERLLVRWDQPRIRAYVRALGAGAQLHEDQTLDLLASTTLENATGHALEQWGELVGEQRGGLSDGAYRQIILAKALAMRCDGTIDRLLEVLAAAAGPDAAAYHEANYPAEFIMWVVRPSFMGDLQLRRVARIMELVRPAGRRMDLIEAITGYFGYTPDDGAEGFDIGPYSRLIRV